MDPLETAVIAVIGGASGKFAEKAWDTGAKWISSYFQHHGPKAKDQALANAADFVGELAQRVRRLEESGAKYKEAIETAQDRPSFSILLQTAIVGAAQTDDKQIHTTLATLVAETLKTPAGSPFEMASKRACAAVSDTTSQQLRLLGLLATISLAVPEFEESSEWSPIKLEAAAWAWLLEILSPYADLSIKPLDLRHLEVLACLKPRSDGYLPFAVAVSRVATSLDILGTHKFSGEEVGGRIVKLWNDAKLGSVELTSIGQLVGMCVLNELNGEPIDLAAWYQ